MKQVSLTMTGYFDKGRGKRTRREQFLAEMDQVVPWARLCGPIEPHYPKASPAGGRPPLPLMRLRRKVREHAASAGHGHENGARRSIPGTQRSIARCALNLFPCPMADAGSKCMQYAQRRSAHSRNRGLPLKRKLMQPNHGFKPGITPPERTQRAASIMLLASIALVMLALPFSASATLGENSTSTEVDRASMKATLRMLPTVKYTVHEIQTPAGTTLREYVSSAGTVFAVAWQGPVIPDLRQALGIYFDRYIEGAKGKHAGHRHIAVREPDLVVQSNGHMRSFSGRAYLPQLLPQGVTVEEIR
jgi:hypothetical protein